MNIYEKKYKEALERATKAKNNASLSDGTLRVLGIIFPELAESEDERTRQQILNYFMDQKVNEPQPVLDTWIAWLKKQNKQKSKWTDEDEKTFKNIDIILFENKNLTKENYWKIINNLKSIKQKLL